LLFGKLVKGGAVKISVADGKLAFDYPPSKTPKPDASPEPELEHEHVK